MITLLIDAATAAVVIADRMCNAVTKAARPGHLDTPPSVRSERAPSPGAGTASASSTGAGGHPSTSSAGDAPAGCQQATQDCTPGGHIEPLSWGPEGVEANQVAIGRWLIAEARWTTSIRASGQPRRY